MNLAAPDYVILALAAGGAVTGAFIGISGSIAFFAGTIAAFLAGRLGWPLSANFLESGLSRGLAVALAVVLAFWIARALVKRLVKVVVAQPGDAIFGSILAAVSGLALGLFIVWIAQFLGVPGAGSSVLLEEVCAHVG